MQKSISFGQANIDYTLRVHARARRLRLSIYYDGRCVVTTPLRVTEGLVEKFLHEKSEWILGKLDHFKKANIIPPKKFSKQEIALYKKEALALAENHLAYFNQFYGFTYKKVTIRNQKTRWGSCSKAGNINFNYKIALLPPELADYIVVHELCHLGQMNHSLKFWELVARTVPEYKALRKKLKSSHKEL